MMPRAINTIQCFVFKYAPKKLFFRVYHLFSIFSGRLYRMRIWTTMTERVTKFRIDQRREMYAPTEPA